MEPGREIVTFWASPAARQAAYAIAAGLGMTQAQAVGVVTLAERASQQD